MLISSNSHKKSNEVFNKTRSPPGSFSFKGQAINEAHNSKMVFCYSVYYIKDCNFKGEVKVKINPTIFLCLIIFEISSTCDTKKKAKVQTGIEFLWNVCLFFNLNIHIFSAVSSGDFQKGMPPTLSDIIAHNRYIAFSRNFQWFGKCV